MLEPSADTVKRNHAIAAIQHLADELELIGLSKQCVSDWVDEQVQALDSPNSTN